MWPFEEEDDGALTVHHDHTFASLRVVTIAEGLEMVSLTQILAWDLPLDNDDSRQGRPTRARHRAGDGVAGRAGGAAVARADVMLRYNFPAAGLTDEALHTLIMMVLSTGVDVRADVDRRRLVSGAQPPQTPKISMVWLTSEKPCSRATSAAHVSTWPPCTSTVQPHTRHTRW